MRISGQWIVVYGSELEPSIYTSVYTFEELVLCCGYARRKYPAADVRAVRASQLAALMK
jgi:hypothetical protein